MLIPIAVTAIIAVTLLRLAGFSLQLLGQRPPMALSSKPGGREMEVCREFEVIVKPNSTSWRLVYGDSPGASVSGWPAKGGQYVLEASAVEVGFLGYGRFENVPRPSAADPGAAAEEEAHCNKSRYPHATLQSYSLSGISDNPQWVTGVGVMEPGFILTWYSSASIRCRLVEERTRYVNGSDICARSARCKALHFHRMAGRGWRVGSCCD